jgi:histidinol-phosphatase
MLKNATMTKNHLEKLYKFSCGIVLQSSEITLKHYKTSAAPESSIKDDNSPVTIADYKCEEFLLKQIKAAYPGHNIYSEESGIEDKGSEFRWFIDPIDGTRNYMRKYPFWGTLLALEFRGKVVIGIISMPAVGQFIAAKKSAGCFINGKKVKVSRINKIEKAYLLYGGLNSILKKQYKENFFKLVSRSFQTRGFGDCHGHSFVINGSAEVMIDPSVAPYDIAATKICLEEAGGKFTDIDGNDSIYNRSALITNSAIHNKVLSVISGR